MDAGHFLKLVIRPTLQRMDKIANKKVFSSRAAEQLMLGTAVHESGGLRYLKQVNSLGRPYGPAVSLYQMEPDTLNSLYNDYLLYHADYLKVLNTFDNENFTRQFLLINNLAYSTAAVRLLYFWKPRALPKAGDLEGIAEYWKKYYNTPLGKGSVEEFIENYHRYVKEDYYD